MPINPITTDKLRTIVLIGHSNADGWAPAKNALAADLPDWSTKHLLPKTNNPVANPELAWWKNIYVATWEQPFPSPSGTPIYSSPNNVDMLELTIANTLSPGDPHPHPSPFDYPNNQGASYPRWNYNAYQINGGFGYEASGTPTGEWLNAMPENGVRTGLEIPLTYFWKNFWGDQVGLCKVAFSSSFFLPVETGSDGFVDPAIFPLGTAPSDYSPGRLGPEYQVSSAIDGRFGYTSNWTPNDQFTWDPGQERLYWLWYEKMKGMAAALPAGTQLDVQMCVCWLGENDSQSKSGETLRTMMLPAIQRFVKRIRKDLVANNWTTLAEHEIPIIWPKVNTRYPAPSPDTDGPGICNAALDQVARDDEYFVALPVEDWNTLDDDGLNPYGDAVLNSTNHYGPSGYRQAAIDVMNAWQGIQQDPLDALDLEEAKTVSEAIDQVRLYYSKSRSNTDLQQELVLQHLNGAMFHVFNHVGDNAWWLRRRMNLSITGSSTELTTLPRYVKRLLKIEDPSDPTYPIQFEQIGHADGGRLQILMHERGTGTYACSFITNPRELTELTQIVPAPRQILEWIVVEACRRLAAASGNQLLSAHFSGEARQLMEDCMRNSGQTQRSKNDVMRTQRRRPHFRYGRGSGRSWWATDY
jgi:hypothetical protein